MVQKMEGRTRRGLNHRDLGLVMRGAANLRSGAMRGIPWCNLAMIFAAAQIVGLSLAQNVQSKCGAEDRCELDRFIVLSLRDWGEKTPRAHHAPFGLGPHSATIRTASVVAGMVVAGQSQGKLAS